MSDLANNLPKDGFYHIKNEFGSNNLELITRKGVYPYDYVYDFKKFKEAGLPSIENFYSKLTVEDISDHDYNHAKNVWEEFKCKTMRDYHDLYLKSDVLILADVNLKLITDIDMYQMVEKGLRGYIANRYSKPNNKYLSDYDKNKDSSYLMYLDANALYSWGMSQPLPTGRFKWLKGDKWDAIFKKKE